MKSWRELGRLSCALPQGWRHVPRLIFACFALSPEALAAAAIAPDAAVIDRLELIAPSAASDADVEPCRSAWDLPFGKALPLEVVANHLQLAKRKLESSGACAV